MLPKSIKVQGQEEPVRPGTRKRASCRRFLVSILAVSLLLMSSACSDSGGQSYAGLGNTGLEIDPLFREFYAYLGGVATLGPAISPLFAAGTKQYQYTESALMVYDSEVPASQRFGLAPLGLDMGIEEPPEPELDVTEARYANGHLIHEEFLDFYNQLGGARFVGHPLTSIHINSEKRRYEQYFSNLGLYRLESEPAGTVHLLAYGVWKCDVYCRQPVSRNNDVVLPSVVGDVFADAVQRLGTSFTGFAISDPYPAADGNLEQIFENLVLYADSNQPGRVLARPITSPLGILPEHTVAASTEPGVYFYPVQGNLGYNIHQAFLDYISQHGGIEITGAPISEAKSVRSGVIRQCYTNLCLEQHTGSSGKLYLRPATLGYSYRSIAVKSTAVQAGGSLPAIPDETQVVIEPTPTLVIPTEVVPTQTEIPYPPPVSQEQPADVSNFIPATPVPQQLIVQVWEAFPMVSPNQRQEIGVSIFSNGAPLAGVEPDLTLILPDGGQPTHYMYPTGQNGLSNLILDPINAPSGTLISYQVCIYNTGGEYFCVRDSFLIWEAP